MKTLRYFITIIMMSWCIIPVWAQFTQQQARDLVLNQILPNELDKVDVYMANTATSGAITMAGGNHGSINMPYTANWVFFVDDLPLANWSHACRYIFVNQTNGSYLTIPNAYPPNDWLSGYTIISEIEKPETIVNLPVNTNVSTDPVPPKPNLYAVIINGIDVWERYWNDVSAVFTTLKDVYGYKQENIFIHYAEGYSTQEYWGNDFNDDYQDDIDYIADKDSILHTFSELAGTTNTSPEIPALGPDDVLFIFVDGWGSIEAGHSYIDLIGTPLADTELAKAVADINCGQIIALLEPNHMIGFKNELSDYKNYNVKCKNRSIQTASDIGISLAEAWITYGEFNEFVYYWVAAARGFYPHKDLPWANTDYQAGEFPFHLFFGTGQHPDDYNPDTNGDGVVQMKEAFDYANNMDTWSPYGYFRPYFPEYIEYPQIFTDISFQEDLLSLSGISGHVNISQTVEGRNYSISDDLIIDGNCNLTLGSNGHFYLKNDSTRLLVEPNASLNIGNNVNFYGKGSNYLDINGNIETGNNVSLNRLGSSGRFGGLQLNNPNMNTYLTGTNFNKAEFYNYGATLNINNCNFNHSNWIYSFNGNVEVRNSHFVETWFHIQNQNNDPNLTAIVEDCIFDNNFMHVGIDMWNYGSYSMTNNNIKAKHNGIQIQNLGYHNNGEHHIIGNNIHDCGRSGILAYDVTGVLSDNYIHNNNIGIRLMNACNVTLLGNPSAQTPSQTQRINNNASYELYTSQYSFPSYFRYNAIVDNDNLGNPNDPLVLCDRLNTSPTVEFDVRHNYWGYNFDPNEDLQAVNGTFICYPTFCPGAQLPPPNPDEDMYISATNYFDNQEFEAAKNLFQLLIQEYPTSNYAQAAMKELLRLEKYVDSDYAGLQNYYLTNNAIVTDTLLSHLADKLANKCDVKLKNWSKAIDWYEDKITNPSCIEDSIFGIIDLGYVYFLMEQEGDRLACSGKLTEFIPETRAKYFEHRDYLLSLLPGKDFDETIKGHMAALKEGELLQNIPNPITAGNTQIWYKLNNEATVQLNIYNYTGQLISSINEGAKLAGTHHISFNATGLTNGVYFYSINIDGQTTDTKKMTIVK